MTIFPALLLLITPNFIMWMWYTVKFHGGSYSAFFSSVLESPNPLVPLAEIWKTVSVGTPFACWVIGGYMLFQIALMKIVPGPRAEGPVTPHGNVPVYVDNGFRIYLITMASFVMLTYYLKTYTVYSPSQVYDNFGDLLATMNAFSIVFCMLLYFKGLFAPSSTDNGSSGNLIFDYYWGTELYPRIFGIDIKVSYSYSPLWSPTPRGQPTDCLLIYSRFSPTADLAARYGR